MSTIRLRRDEELRGAGFELVARIVEREKRVFGATTLSNIWRCMAHRPDYLESNWERSRAIMQRGKLKPLVKEMVASGISIINACEY